MSIYLPFKWAWLKDCEVGDLVGLVDQGNLLVGLVIFNGDERTIVGVLRDDDRPKLLPYKVAWHPVNECLKFSEGWELEVLPPPFKLIDTSLSTVPGSISIEFEGPNLRFGPHPTSPGANPDPSWFNLETKKAKRSLDTSHVVASGWKLWLGASDKRSPGAKPYVSMDEPVRSTA